LPEVVADTENLTRFLTQSSHFNSFGAKPSVFLPNPRSRNTSIFRIERDAGAVRQAWEAHAAGAERVLRGYAVVIASDVRSQSLEIVAEEPPPAHANLENWPWIEDDPELQEGEAKRNRHGDR